ncbi:MAG: DUF4065 domain-containing protein [Solobacterium sp.]|nr:DUF4065 domain-containing protein [Solobacterium sp.]
MKMIRSEKKMCPCCMEEHEVQTVEVSENNTFKETDVRYAAEYSYCAKTDTLFADEDQLSRNDIRMKNAYRAEAGLMTSFQIAALREQYGITQSDLCLLLGWGGKTITRYESHQVQDAAHDTILRKLDSDPEWFLQLLQMKKDALPKASYEKYMAAGTALFELHHDLYLTRIIMSRYARFMADPDANGNRILSLETAADMIRYFANSPKVTKLYLVKLVKLLWYADALSYKRRGHAISGLVYRALPMGAVPVAYESLMDLSSVHYEEQEIGDGIGYIFCPTENTEYPSLSSEDRQILEEVISRFGDRTKREIVNAMHQEDAYRKTAGGDIILYRYTRTLSMK